MSSSFMHVRRSSSDTPLAKVHARLLERSPSRPRRPIPWEKFVRSELPEQALELAADQARKLAEGEYAAVAIFGQVAAGLAMTRAPFDIVSACASIGGDEIRHADYCAHMAERCSAAEVDLFVPRHEVMRECRDVFELEQLDYLLLKYSAVGESLAAALLAECEAGARVPIARTMYGNLVRDEIHHARLGWYYFQWRAPQWSLPEKQRLADRIAEFVVDIEQEFWWGRDASATHHDAAIALGVLDTERQRLAIAQVMEQDLVPGLDALGLGGSHAWRARQRGSRSSRRRAAAWVATSTPVDAARVIDRAAAWLAAQVDANGSLRFMLDARGESGHGSMQHGRSAVVLEALRAHAGHVEASARLAEQLQSELQAAHEQRLPTTWPSSAWTAAGTYALACLAGLDCKQALLAQLQALPRAATDACTASNAQEAAWHAGQIVSVLGVHAPEWIWLLAKQELASERWAPWSARAARARGDAASWAIGRDMLVATLMQMNDTLPTAVIAATLETLALDDSGDEQVASAITRGRAYLCSVQLDAAAGASAGAFPLSTREPMLRVDVTAHALLALHATRAHDALTVA